MPNPQRKTNSTSNRAQESRSASTGTTIKAGIAVLAIMLLLLGCFYLLISIYGVHGGFENLTF